MNVYHIGYLNPQAASQIEHLMRNPRVLLIDIRETPISRFRPAWNRTSLVERWQDRYVWLKELGNIHHRQRDRHKGIVLRNPAYGLSFVRGLLQEYDVILLCACKEYEECHRKLVMEMLQVEVVNAA